mgnify:CR=1 FL=1
MKGVTMVQKNFDDVIVMDHQEQLGDRRPIMNRIYHYYPHIQIFF